ncbi:hypothetical protein [Litoreibacter halocynthiae]|uniref:hypothetical protein n=1 Tax=Litoreibacter halocynthiae TaxID=1242689 RepID=UPI0024932102|nr:hypothetical protein [Litoreibacter halocynthiae]
MGLKFLVSAFLVLGSGQQALAAREDDAKYIVLRIMPESKFDKARDHFALMYADVYAKMLRERSIKIIDREGFAKLLPPSISDGQVSLLRERVVKHCLSKFSDEELVALARTLKSLPEDLHSLPQSHFDEEALVLKASMAVAICYAFAIGGVSNQLKQSGERPPTVFLPKILEDNSIVSFPNRIVKQSVIAEFKKQE